MRARGTKLMRYGSVCSGVEAASLAWQPLGWECAFTSEIEKFPAAVLAHHWPHVPNLGDMTDDSFIQRAREQGPIDLLVGGTPCQSFSVAGLRGGLDDERGNLALQFCRIADRLTPRWIVWENVPGVLSSGGGRDFGSIVGAMVELGYNVAWRILDAQNFGVPQRRRRIFLIGHLGEYNRGAAAVLFEQHCLQGHPAPSREAREDLAPTVSAGPPFSRTGNERVEAQALVPIAWDEELNPSINRAGTILRGGQGGRHDGVVVPVTDGINRDSAKMVPIWRGSDQANAETVEGQAGTLNCNKGQQGGIVALPCGEVVGTVTARKGRNNGIPSIGTYDEVMPTIPANPMSDRGAAVAFAQNTRDEANLISGDGSIAGALAAEPGMKQQTYVKTDMQVRRLTPKECERLQGMPDDHTKIPWRGGKYRPQESAEDCPDGPRYKAIGNSMAVPVMRWIGERIDKVEETLND